ncbi:MAG: HlyD family secretion protein [Polyangiales bacterium]
MAVAVVHFVATSAPGEPRADDIAHAQRTEDNTGEGQREEGVLARPPNGTWVAALGVFEPKTGAISLQTGLPGRISDIAVQVGQTVQMGQVLLQLEDDVEQAILAASDADVDAARAEMARQRRGRPLDISAAEAEAAAADSRARLSRNVFHRTEQAAAGGAATLDELDRARLQAAADDATRRNAEARRDASRRGRREDVSAAGARLAGAEARRDQALATLERMRIRAPCDAEVLALHFEVGEYLSPGAVTPALELGDTSEMRARLDLDERDVGKVAVGALVVLSIDGQAQRQFEGRVVELGKRMRARNGAATVDRDDMVVLDVLVSLDNAADVITDQRVFAFIESGDL